MAQDEWLTVDSLDLEAQGVARRSDGKVVFIEGALPGEVVTITTLKRKPTYEIARAEAFRPGQRKGQEHRVAGRHVRRRNAGFVDRAVTIQSFRQRNGGRGGVAPGNELRLGVRREAVELRLRIR